MKLKVNVAVLTSMGLIVFFFVVIPAIAITILFIVTFLSYF